MKKLLCLLTLCISCGIVSAQTSGEITGEVKDQSGAGAANVNVTATNADTGVARTTQTNEAGLYSFPAMIPGTYSVKVTAPGFEVVTKTNILLEVQQTARVDFSLTVGQASQTIEVAANGELLTTDNATVGTVIEQKRIVDLPLNGRNFFSLVALSPGVTVGFSPAAQATNRQGGSRSTLTMSLAGARATWSNYTLDGITNTDVNFNLYVLLPSVDAIQEFKVQSGVYPAEFGREAGQINVSTRPGTNAYHGTVFEFLRNDKFDATPYDFNGNSPAKGAYRQNQYGYTLGGPIQIPKVFNGKNRLFFMSNYEGFKSRTASVNLATTMTQRMINGDFSVDPATGIGVATALQDPLTRQVQPNGSITSSPFPGNVIPKERLDKNSLLLISRFFPLPNIVQQTKGLPLNNYQYTTSTPVDKDQITERIDFNERASSQWFGRYSWTDESQISPGLTTDGSTLYTRGSQWVVSNTRILSPTRVNEARFGYNSLFNVIGQQLANVEDVDAEIGVPVKITDKASWGIPNISLNNNLSAFGNATSSPFTIDNKTFQGIDNFSWIIGKHSVRMGGEYRYNKFPQQGNEFPRGQFFFRGFYTATNSAPNAAGTISQTGGYAGADLVLGNADRVDIAVALAQGDFRNHEWAGYIDDTWRIRPHLTISAGLRWEVELPLEDVSGHSLNVQLNGPLPANGFQPDLSKHPVLVRTGTGGFYDGLDFRYTPNQVGAPPVQTARDGRLGNRLIASDYNNFAPRLGLAWSPSDKWSIRVGAGIFFSQESKNSIFDMNRGLGGRAAVLPPDTLHQPTINYTNFLSAASLPVNVTAGLVWGTAYHLPTTYTMNYMLNVQRTIGKSSTLELGYNGSESRHLELLTNQDAPLPGNGPNVVRFPYPEFSGIQFLSGDGVGNYNSFTAKFSQRYSNGLSTLLSYTWAKSLDDMSAIRGPGNEFAPQNSLCRSCDYGPSTFDIPQRFSGSVLYSLPFGKGKQFLNHGGIVNQIVGGWQVSNITTLQSGPPIDTTGWDAAGTNFSPPSNRLNCTGIDPILPNPTIKAWLNPAAFSNPLVGTYGNCGRNDFRGPRKVNVDFSTIKDFRVTETQALQFRVEMFNAPNHPEWAAPNASWGNSNSGSTTPSGTFGQVRGTAASMRQIQFGLKYNF
jgi:Carboxypeptidase regulatory-like domain